MKKSSRSEDDPPAATVLKVGCDGRARASRWMPGPFLPKHTHGAGGRGQPWSGAALQAAGPGRRARIDRQECLNMRIQSLIWPQLHFILIFTLTESLNWIILMIDQVTPKTSVHQSFWMKYSKLFLRQFTRLTINKKYMLSKNITSILKTMYA